MNDFQLTAVSETLFLPLYALALESQSEHPIMVDEGAVDLTRRLNEALAGSDSRIARRLVQVRLPGILLASMALRVRRYDAYVRAFLEREPATGFPWGWLIAPAALLAAAAGCLALRQRRASKATRQGHIR